MALQMPAERPEKQLGMSGRRTAGTTPLTLIRSVRGQRNDIGETRRLQELIADIKGQKDV